MFSTTGERASRRFWRALGAAYIAFRGRVDDGAGDGRNLVIGRASVIPRKRPFHTAQLNRSVVHLQPVTGNFASDIAYRLLCFILLAVNSSSL